MESVGIGYLAATVSELLQIVAKGRKGGFALAHAQREGRDSFHVGGAVELPKIDNEPLVVVFLQSLAHIGQSAKLAGKIDHEIGVGIQPGSLSEQTHHLDGVAAPVIGDRGLGHHTLPNHHAEKGGERNEEETLFHDRKKKAVIVC